MNNCLGIINLSEVEIDIQELTKVRPIAGLPFAGRYRVIDFSLSNLVNSGVNKIAIFTHNKFRSLMDHIGSGKPWDLDRKINGISIMNPMIDYNKVVQKVGDIEHFYNNLDYLKGCNEEYVFISRSYMVCNIDLKEAFRAHKRSNRDITIIYKRVKNEPKFINLDVLNIGMNNTLMSIGKNTGKSENINLSMEMYMMKRETLIKIIEKAIDNGTANYVKQALFNQLPEYTVNTFPFDGYLACVNSNKNYFDANMDMLDNDTYEHLFNEERPIFTKVKDEPSTWYKNGSNVKNSIVANGSIIEGDIKNSIIFRNVQVKPGVTIRNSVIMQNTIIEENASLNSVISDKFVRISKNKTFSGDQQAPYIIKKAERL